MEQREREFALEWEDQIARTSRTSAERWRRRLEPSKRGRPTGGWRKPSRRPRSWPGEPSLWAGGWRTGVPRASRARANKSRVRANKVSRARVSRVPKGTPQGQQGQQGQGQQGQQGQGQQGASRASKANKAEQGQQGQQGQGQQGAQGDSAQGQQGQQGQGQQGAQGDSAQGQQGQQGQGQQGAQGDSAQGQQGQQGQGQQGQQGQGQGGERPGDSTGQGGGRGGDPTQPQEAGDLRTQGIPFGGAMRGNPEPFTEEEIAQYTREFAQRLAQARDLLRTLEADGQEVQDLKEAIDALEALEDPGTYGDLPQIAMLQGQIQENLKRLEFLLRREVEGERPGRAALTGSDEVPAGFRKMVEEYFKNLARRGGGGS